MITPFHSFAAVHRRRVVKKPLKKAAVKKSTHPLSGGVEPVEVLLKAAKVTPGKKRVVRKPPREDAPF